MTARAVPTPDRGYHDIRVHGLMVVGPGEGDRWLDACLRWNTPMLDTLYVYDDRSGEPDGQTVTWRLLASHCNRSAAHDRTPVMVTTRFPHQPSFLEHEGRFRSNAWASWEDTVRPENGDWVYLFDADEFTVPNHRLVGGRAALQASAMYADLCDLPAVGVPIPEVWGLTPDGQPLERLDGAWAGNVGPRLVRWQPDGGTEFPDRAMACGSLPIGYIERLEGAPLSKPFMRLLHYGYVDPADRAAKWDRYSALLDHGHANTHIESIRTPPQLAPLTLSEVPSVWRGVRTA